MNKRTTGLPKMTAIFRRFHEPFGAGIIFF